MGCAVLKAYCNDVSVRAHLTAVACAIAKFPHAPDLKLGLSPSTEPDGHQLLSDKPFLALDQIFAVSSSFASPHPNEEGILHLKEN